jgi:hypothetical protein
MKRMREISRVCLVMLLVITGLLVTATSISLAASNLNLSKSNINRIQGAQIVSATVSLSGSDQTQAVYITPDTGEFLLTQLCVSPVNGGIRLAASGFGPIAHLGGAICTTFSPGVIVPKNSTVTCSTTGYADSGDYFCTISGLLAH